MITKEMLAANFPWLPEAEILKALQNVEELKLQIRTKGLTMVIAIAYMADQIEATIDKEVGK